MMDAIRPIEAAASLHVVFDGIDMRQPSYLIACHYSTSTGVS